MLHIKLWLELWDLKPDETTQDFASKFFLHSYLQMIILEYRTSYASYSAGLNSEQWQLNISYKKMRCITLE